MRELRHTSRHVRALAIGAALAIPLGGAASIALSGVASAQVVTPTLTGKDIHVTEGPSGTVGIADLSPELFFVLSNITVSWGDGSSLDTTAALVGNHVRGAHTYAEAGSYTVTVNADATAVPQGPQGDGPGSVIELDTTHLSTTLTATVDEAHVNLFGEQEQIAPGGAFDGTVADGDDHNAAAHFSDFSAVIDWGDGSTPQACTACVVPTGGNEFGVDASHQYASAGLYRVHTQVQDGGADVREHPVSTLIAVPITASSVSATEGTAFNGTVGSLLLSRQLDIASVKVPTPTFDTATIDWGDGSSTTGGTVAEDGTVSGSHTYAEEGTYTITLTGGGGPEVAKTKPAPADQATNTVTVSDASLTGTAAQAGAYSATQGQSFTAVLANVVDNAASGKSGDISATIDWGDGSTSNATLSNAAAASVSARVAGGGQNAGGTHTYTSGGTKNGVVHFVDLGGSKANVPFSVNVTASQVQGITSTPTPAPGSGGNTGSGPGAITTPNTGSDLPISTAALLIASGGSLLFVGRRRRS